MKAITIQLPFFILLSVVFISATQVQAQQFYKWVDQKGSTHYTTTAPPKHARCQGIVTTYTDSVTKPNPSTLATPSSNSVPAPSNLMDQQQREANAALHQGRQR